MTRRTLLALTIVLAAAGCAAPPPSVQRVVAHGAAADAGGTLLVVDVCLNYSPLVTGDYFVIASARSGAAALELATQQFLDAADVRSRSALIPFVCGALHDPANAPKRVADEIDGAVSERAQPLWVAPALAADADYVDALQTLATHVFRRSVAAYDKDKPAAPALDTNTNTNSNSNSNSNSNTNSNTDAVNVTGADAADDERARRAAAVVAQKSGRSSLLYVGVTGHSLSSGKATAAGVARVVAGLAISLGLGPVFTAGGAQYGVVFVPGGPVDKRQMAAGLVDLRQGQLVRSRVVGSGGDPMKPEVVAERNGLNLLLRDLLLTSAP